MSTSLLAAALIVTGFQGAKPDEKAQEAYDALQAKLGKSKSAKATLEVIVFGRQDNYEFRFLRPNFAKVTSPDTAIYQDGKRFFDYNVLDKEYFEKVAPMVGLPAGTSFSLGGLVGLETLGFSNEPKLVPVAVSRKNYSGIAATAISLTAPTDKNVKATIWLELKSGLPIGWDYAVQDFKASGRIKNLVLEYALKPADFAWSPPKGAKKIG